MAVNNGYLLIADISGYTAYLTTTELEHANPILRSLLEALIGEVGDPLHLWRMEGDAVLAYSSEQGFPSGDAFLTICENLYNSFIRRRTDIRANTTCPCNACANIESLDLKILAHFGEFEEMKLGPMTDISGPAAILVHLMAKTDVKEKTGVRSYALFSRAAVDEMKLGDVPMIEYKTSFDHFGEVPMAVYDLAKAWETYRECNRTVITEEDAVLVYRHRTRQPIRMVWEYLVSAELKEQWMGLRSVTATHDGPRRGVGTGYHCVHDAMEFRYWVTDWQPFDYFSTRIQAPMNPALSQNETYRLVQDGDEVEVVYLTGPLRDADGVHHPEEEKIIVDFLENQFWPQAFAALDVLMAERHDRGSG